MKHEVKSNGNFNYVELGEGTPIVILHGLMGGLSNFNGVSEYFPGKGYKVIIPELPLYDLPLIKTSVGTLAKFTKKFIDFLDYDQVILLGNSLGGHVSLLTTKWYPEKVKGLIITGSSGLYESAMGTSYPKKGSYEYIRKKAQNVFYHPEVATKEVVDEVFETVSDRSKLIRSLAVAKSAIRHNMRKDLPNMNTPTCIIWGKQDTVTPPEVAEDFHELLPDSDLYWVDECGHAAMMEHPQEFNRLVHYWLEERKF